MAKPSERAKVVQVGGFKDDGLPDDKWVFDKAVRLRKSPDGNDYSYGGWSREQLIGLVEAEKFKAVRPEDVQGGVQDAAQDNGDRGAAPTGVQAPVEGKSGAKATHESGGKTGGSADAERGKGKSDIRITLPDSGGPAERGGGTARVDSADRKETQTNHAPGRVRTDARPPKVFEFSAEITGVAAKFVKDQGIRKELKLLSPDMQILEKIDLHLRDDVKVKLLIEDAYFSSFDDVEKFEQAEEHAAEQEAVDEAYSKQVNSEQDVAAFTGAIDALNEQNAAQTPPEPEKEPEAITGPDLPGAQVETPAGELPIETPPAPVDEGIPFTCGVCGGQLKTDPNDSTQWMCVTCDWTCPAQDWKPEATQEPQAPAVEDEIKDF